MTDFEKMFNSLLATTVGFDPVWQMANRQVSNFPHYDIVKSDNDNYTIEIALAGYGPNDVEVTYLPGNVTIQTISRNTEEDPSRVYRGIAKRSFKLSFPLAQYVEVGSVLFDNGLLCISLVRNVPEAARPRKIEIGYAPDTSNVTKLAGKQKQIASG